MKKITLIATLTVVLTLIVPTIATAEPQVVPVDEGATEEPKPEDQPKKKEEFVDRPTLWIYEVRSGSWVKSSHVATLKNFRLNRMMLYYDIMIESTPDIESMETGYYDSRIHGIYIDKNPIEGKYVAVFYIRQDEKDHKPPLINAHYLINAQLLDSLKPSTDEPGFKIKWLEKIQLPPPIEQTEPSPKKLRPIRDILVA